MPAVQLNVYGQSDVGRVRANNEDAFTVTDLHAGDTIEGEALRQLDVQQRGVLMVVSDGMGGHAAGEVASALVVDSLRKSLGEAGSRTESMQRLIDRAVKRANEDVWKAAREERRHGMGATLTAVLVHEREAYIAEVGDSRAYLHRTGRLRQMTKDQSFVQLLVDAGELTAEEAKDAPQKNLILQAMGLERSVQVSIGRLHLRRGDRLLLCSDGLTNHVTDDELTKLLDTRDLVEACKGMIALANDRGGEDNVTAIVAHFDGDGLPIPSALESVTQTFSVLQEFGKLPPSPQPDDCGVVTPEPSEDACERSVSTVPPPDPSIPASGTGALAVAQETAHPPAWVRMALGALVAMAVAVVVWYFWLH